jgi:hypothetical protein
MLGHIGFDVIRKMARDGELGGLEISMPPINPFCDSCEKGKAMRQPIAKERTEKRSDSPGHVLHFDYWGPSKIQARGGFNGFNLGTDDATRYRQIDLVKAKSECAEKVKRAVTWWKTQHGVNTKKVHSDRGGEYTSGQLQDFFAENGMEQSLTAHDSHEQAGVAERANRTLLNYTRTMLVASGLPKFLWGDCLEYAVWIANRVPTKAIGKSPYEAVYGRKPDLTRAHEFGCKVLVKRNPDSKLEARAEEGRWIGPSRSTEDGHKVYWPKTRRVTVERDVVFVPGDDIEEECIPVDSGVSEASKNAENVQNTHQNTPAATQLSSPSNAMSRLSSSTVTSPKSAPSSHPANPSIPASQMQQNSRLEPVDDSKDPLHGLEPMVEDEESNTRPQRVRKPSAYVRDLLDGVGSASGRANAPRVPRGIQMPSGGAAAVTDISKKRNCT